MRSIRGSRRPGPISPRASARQGRRPRASSRATARGRRRRRRRCAARPRPTRRSTPRRSRASASRSTRRPRKAGPGASSQPTAMSAGCRRTRSRAPGPRADAQGRGAAHAGVSRARRSSCRRSRRCRSAAGSRSRASTEPFAVTQRGGFVPARHLAPLDAQRERLRRGRRAIPRRALSVGRQDQLRHRLLGPGAARAHRLRHRLPARQRHAGARARRGARAMPTSPTCGAAISVLEGPCRDRARRRNAAARQRLPHGGRDRADRATRSRASAPPAASIDRALPAARFARRDDDQ